VTVHFPAELATEKMGNAQHGDGAAAENAERTEGKTGAKPRWNQVSLRPLWLNSPDGGAPILRLACAPAAHD